MHKYFVIHSRRKATTPQAETNVKSRRGIEQTGLARVDATQHQLGVTALAKLYEVYVESEDLPVRVGPEGCLNGACRGILTGKEDPLVHVPEAPILCPVLVI